MNTRRTLVAAALSSLAFAGLFGLAAGAHAQGEPLRVATDATFPPMEFVENGKRTGFDVELVEAIGKTLGRKIEWIDIDFKGLVPGLISKRFDMAVSGIYITDERKKVVDFTVPYYAVGLVVMVKEGNTTIKTPADINGKKVSVQVGTKSVAFTKEKYPQVQLQEVEKNQEMFALVDIGRADAAVTGKPAAYQYVRTRGDVAGKGVQIQRAVRLLEEGLKGGLDEARGGDLAARLRGLYDYCIGRLTHANIRNDAAALTEVVALISPVADGWKEMGRLRNAQPA